MGEWFPSPIETNQRISDRSYTSQGTSIATLRRSGSRLTRRPALLAKVSHHQ